MEFNVNNADVVRFTNKLEKLHRSAFPVTVRQSLNELAFDVKKNQIVDTFAEQFTIRKKNFIRSHTAFNRSPNTFELSQMESSIGVIKNKSGAGNQLEKQEFGGRIQNRSKIAQTQTRIGRKDNKLVAKKYYFEKYKTAPKGLISRSPKETIFKTKDAIIRVKKGGKIETLYKISRNVKIDKNPFLKPAAEKSFKKMPEIFRKLAQKRILRGFK